MKQLADENVLSSLTDVPETQAQTAQARTAPQVWAQCFVQYCFVSTPMACKGH